jgi:hypothetical protein
MGKDDVKDLIDVRTGIVATTVARSAARTDVKSGVNHVVKTEVSSVITNVMPRLGKRIMKIREDHDHPLGSSRPIAKHNPPPE